MTGWAVLGLEAAGVNPLDVDHGDATPITYLAGTVGEISTTGDIERTILLLRGAGLDPAPLPGPRPGPAAARPPRRRWILGRAGEPDRLRDPGPEGGGVRPPATRRSAAWLRANQNQDGGWGFAAKAASDPGQHRRRAAGAGARPAAGPARAEAVAYLRGVQRSGGGFALAGGPVNAQSTAWAAQGLGRGRALAGLGAERGPLGARLPRLGPGARRPLPLLVLHRPDAGLGDRPGPARGQRQALPARAGAEGRLRRGWP